MNIIQALAHPDDLVSLIKYQFLGGAERVTPKVNLSKLDEPLKVCYQLLKRTSRSFAAVIQALDEQLRDAVCLFYLILRALDTVEDDTTIPTEEKLPVLKKFHEFLEDPNWSYSKSTFKDGIVLEKFPVISAQYRCLKPAFREVIKDITARMGAGMGVFLEKEVDTSADWNEYCHYVAGLVGIGLSRLFTASGLEDEVVGASTDLSNSMGLFLQKTNIIRDYLEDVVDHRHFWPKEVWSQYGKTLDDFRRRDMAEQAVACLNHLITDALQHVPDVMTYLSRLKTQSVFNFCAIPQVMAIATLARCYNNHKVFTGVVKIRKGEACSLMMEANRLDKTMQIFFERTLELGEKLSITDPNATATLSAIQTILMICRSTPASHESLALVTEPSLKIQLPVIQLTDEDKAELYRLSIVRRRNSSRFMFSKSFFALSACLLAATYQYWGQYVPAQYSGQYLSLNF